MQALYAPFAYNDNNKPTSSQNLGRHLEPTQLSSCKSSPSPSSVNSTSFQNPTAIALIQLLVISLYTIAQSPHCHFYPLVLLPSASSSA